jgi:hypothetical protein
LDSGNVKILERKIPDREVLGKLGYMAQEEVFLRKSKIMRSKPLI